MDMKEFRYHSHGFPDPFQKLCLSKMTSCKILRRKLYAKNVALRQKLEAFKRKILQNFLKLYGYSIV